MTRPLLPSSSVPGGHGLARIRSQLLAALVAAHVAAVLLLALPANSRLSDRAVWQSPENQLQFAAWARLANRFGIAQDGPELEQKLWVLTQRYLRVRGVLAAPCEFYAEHAGVHQNWRMFSNPQTYPVYVHIELRRGASFEPIYVSRSSEFTWRREQLDHHRLRKLFGSVARSAELYLWDEFGAWAARQAAADFPDAVELRIWQERRVTAGPGKPDPPGSPPPEQIRQYDLLPSR